MSQDFDLLIKGGRVIDAALNTDAVMDVGIYNSKIVAVERALPAENAKRVVNADGCIVTAGLIDYHTHFYDDATDLGLCADMSFPAASVTAAVDAGSAGVSNIAGLYKTIHTIKSIHAKAFLNVISTGMATASFSECPDPACYDEQRIYAAFEKYSDILIGLKVRIQKEKLQGFGIETLEKTIRIAECLSCPVCVHCTNPVIDCGEIADMLRPGDIFCHMYHGDGNTILNQNFSVKKQVLHARERGVLFDASNGRKNWSFKTAIPAIREGFFPDIISTDWSAQTAFINPVKMLPFIISKYVCLGMDLAFVIKACTQIPAELMDMKSKIGILSHGAYADISVLKPVEQNVTFYDTDYEKLAGNILFMPQMTIKGGRIVFAAMDFEN
jgi:predicted amidohydrolase